VACDTPELVGNDRVYDTLVCSGLSQFNSHHFTAAVIDWARASQMNLDEMPNFRLLPKLALAYWKAGDPAKASETLGEAKMALEVVAGVKHCAPEGKRGLLDEWMKPIVDSLAVTVANRMCGEAYEDWYHRDSIQAFVRDADVMRIYLETAKVMHT